jgi:hypothetical protein
MVIALAVAAAPNGLCLGSPMRRWMRHWLSAAVALGYRRDPRGKPPRRLATGFARAYRRWAPVVAPTD